MAYYSPQLRNGGSTSRRFSSECDTLRRARILDCAEKTVKRHSAHMRSPRQKPVDGDSSTVPTQDPSYTGIPSVRLRSKRSHSLMVGSMQAPVLPHRSNRTFSLPCSSRPIIFSLGNVHTRTHGMDEDYVECEEEYLSLDESMGWYTPIAGLSCSFALFVWSCLLSHYYRG
ncbi:predicted protein [Nematostella vectensis]|uniref:Uncharacterized protein n=1 Tax=Nematostella vectensis TaxID=45351 RepID=A7SPM4_NEMVE|nr:uncharacterized protein LOC5505665 isoform X2 [Nematostella vectensis]EDO34331.1 predicted protein [Nematostella vectensis]|eukprot:XP_001626431.1 predicted protein [Nematostella vectensis]